MDAEIGRRAFAATAEDIPRAVAFVTGLAGKAGLGEANGRRLELAVEEWIVNLCRHAYREGAGTIEVTVAERCGRLLVEIADEGPPFDPTRSPDPDVAAPLDEREPGGLGLLLIRRMTDEFGYRREGGRNVVTLAVAVTHS